MWSYIFKKSDKKDDDLINLLRSVPIFDNLNTKELSAIEKIIHVRHYGIGEVVFAEDEPGVGLYIISKGAVKITKKDMEAKDISLASLKEGQFFGELSLLDNSPRSATAVTSEPSILLGFFHPDLMNLIDRTPSLGCKVLIRLSQLLGERLRKTNELLRI